MYLKKSNKDGRTYLSIMKGYREDGKSKSRTVKGLGYLDELEKDYPDPIAHFQDLAKTMTEEEREKGASAEITINPLQRIDKRANGQRKNIGCAIALSHYNSLDIERTLRNAARDRHFGYDTNAIMRLLVCERVLDPGSKLAAFDNRERYFFRSRFSRDDMGRALDFFAEYREALIAAMNRSLEKAERRAAGCIFYDVSNHYFEYGKEDEPQGRGTDKKEAASDKPIMQIGLLQDQSALPIAYRTFVSNTNDLTTLSPVLRELKSSYALKDVVVVADKSFNTTDNIAACYLGKNGFIFPQSIHAMKPDDELRSWILAEDGFAQNINGSFKTKSRLDVKDVHLRTREGKKIADVHVNTKLVAFWSAEYEARAKKKRAEVIAKAEELIRSPLKYNKQTHYNAARYVKNIAFDKTTGAVVEVGGKHAQLDEEGIAEAAACDGYYCLITSKTDWPDDLIIETYEGLWPIEEAFKITQANTALHPSFTWTEDQIEAHFLVCFIALTILRLIQSDTSFTHSAASIREEMQAMTGTAEDGNWWLFDHRTSLSDELCSSVGIDLSLKRMRLEDIKKILTQVNKKQH